MASQFVGCLKKTFPNLNSFKKLFPITSNTLTLFWGERLSPTLNISFRVKGSHLAQHTRRPSAPRSLIAGGGKGITFSVTLGETLNVCRVTSKPTL